MNWFKTAASPLLMLLLLIAILPMHDSYYAALRIVVSLVALALALLQKPRIGLNFLILLIIFILFNPIVLIHLNRGTWIIVDVVLIMYFGILSKQNLNSHQ